jgi:DNA-binding GntR family transcriptional regulator
MIIDFDLPPGSRVTEQELADQFKVSRTPVREALQRLKTEGYLMIRPKQGCFIRPVDIEAIAAHYDVRVALEAMAVEMACEHMPAEDLKALADFWDPANRDKNLTQGTHVSLVEETFHVQIAEGSGNSILVNYLRDVNDRIRIIRRLGFPDETSVLETCQEHYEICQLLLKRKAKPAREAMILHIRKSQEIARTTTLSQIEQHKSHRGLRRKPR